MRRLAGFSMGQADLIRRAMSKKHKDEIERERVTFINGDEKRGICGAVANGVPADVANSIYDEIIDFAEYAFNKAHAVSYAIVCYQTAYLKCHYPREYMAALLSSVLDLPEKVAEYTAEIKDMGIELLPPDVNESDNRFTVSGEHIRYGLAAVKNIGSRFIETVMAEREARGNFSSFEDFCERMYGTELNRRAAESLIKAGAFDSLGLNRKQLMQICPLVLDSVADKRRKNVEGQLDLFGSAESDEGAMASIKVPDIEDFTHIERMAMEREVTGLYLSGHPMDNYRDRLKRAGAVAIGRIMSEFAPDFENPTLQDNDSVLIAGVVNDVKHKQTKNGGMMAYVTVNDGTGDIELLVFSKVLEDCQRILENDALIYVRGRLSVRDEKAPQIVANEIKSIESLAAPSREPLRTEKKPGAKLYLRVAKESPGVKEKLRQLLTMFEGETELILYFADTGKKYRLWCLMHDALIDELRERFGEENVVIK